MVTKQQATATLARIYDIVTHGWPGEQTLDAIGALSDDERKHASMPASEGELRQARMFARIRAEVCAQERRDLLDRAEAKRRGMQ